MADIQVINHGELQWDAKANHNFSELNQALEKVGGVTDQLKWTTSNDGVVFLNGWHGNVTYSYVQIGDKKLVSLTGTIDGNAKAAQYTELLTIPDNIKPKNRMIQYRYWDAIVQIVDNKIGVHSGADIKDSTNGPWNLVFEFTYVC
ncbi:hypothetical protein [Limosilactobacillus oris]|uniref:hypothetical protein n=1 Tax=Limosilactobacillus oris TaxID=1632 RepID=UPI0022365995|nr:hypothetical protein [Limosilactobacillus oris]MCW4387059.1 hypothetical protein [Limosilactobacillus oris]